MSIFSGSEPGDGMTGTEIFFFFFSNTVLDSKGCYHSLDSTMSSHSYLVFAKLTTAVILLLPLWVGMKGVVLVDSVKMHVSCVQCRVN